MPLSQQWKDSPLQFLPPIFSHTSYVPQHILIILQQINSRQPSSFSISISFPHPQSSFFPLPLLHDTPRHFTLFTHFTHSDPSTLPDTKIVFAPAKMSSRPSAAHLAVPRPSDHDIERGVELNSVPITHPFRSTPHPLLRDGANSDPNFVNVDLNNNNRNDDGSTTTKRLWNLRSLLERFTVKDCIHLSRLPLPHR